MGTAIVSRQRRHRSTRLPTETASPHAVPATTYGHTHDCLLAHAGNHTYPELSPVREASQSRPPSCNLARSRCHDQPATSWCRHQSLGCGRSPNRTSAKGRQRPEAAHFLYKHDTATATRGHVTISKPDSHASLAYPGSTPRQRCRGTGMRLGHQSRPGKPGLAGSALRSEIRRRIQPPA